MVKLFQEVEVSEVHLHLEEMQHLEEPLSLSPLLLLVDSHIRRC